jgi:hypothetical protein
MKTQNTFLKQITVFFFLSFMMISCDKSSTPEPQGNNPVITSVGTPSGELNSTSIGASGGTISSTDGNLTVIIPTGALTSAAEISIQPISNEAPLGLGSGYRLEPEGKIFNKPVQLVFHYTEQLLNETPANFLWIVSQAADGSWNAMLKSVVNTDSKTVTIETTHFSDWALGKFIELSLNPPLKTVQKGKTVQLELDGFSRDKEIQDDDELAPLVPITGDIDGLTPLTPIPPVESRLMSFKIKKWTLNGTAAPVTTVNGSLSASGNSATYTAPNEKPSVNPEAVSVEVETIDKAGAKSKFVLTSNITVITDYNVSLKIDGKSYEYIQYGFTTSTPPDPENFSMVLGSLADGRFELLASIVSTKDGGKDVLELSFDNPSLTTRSLIGSNYKGNDVLTFEPLQGNSSYELDYTKRTPGSDNSCDRTYLCGNASVTLTTYPVSNKTGYFSEVGGYFSGTIYEDKSGYDNNCISSDAHTIEGEFLVMVSN